jgi:hypothetical protein
MLKNLGSDRGSVKVYHVSIAMLRVCWTVLDGDEDGDGDGVEDGDVMVTKALVRGGIPIACDPVSPRLVVYWHASWGAPDWINQHNSY